MQLAELYLALEGPSGSVTGDVEAAGYEGQVQIENWRWSLALNEQWAAGQDAGGSTGERSHAKPLKLSKQVDRASTALMRGAAQQTKFPSARITLLHRVHKSSKLVIVLGGVRIERYNLAINAADSEITLEEDFSLGFESIRIEYKPRDTAGGRDGRATGAVHSFEMRSKAGDKR